LRISKELLKTKMKLKVIVLLFLGIMNGYSQNTKKPVSAKNSKTATTNIQEKQLILMKVFC